MAYEPYYTNGWYDTESGDTPITAAALNNMEDGIGQNSDNLSYSNGDTFSMVGQTSFAGAVTASSKTIYLNVPVDKLLDNISSISVTSLTGGIRAVNGNYVNGVLDGAEWVGLTGITISAAKASGRNVRVTITSTSAFTSGGSTLTNNTPLTLVGTVTLSFS